MLDDAFAALARENEQLLRKADMRQYMPTIDDSAGRDTRCDAPLDAFGATGLAFTTVHAFDMAARDKSTAQTVISRPGATYVSDSRLYVAVTNHDRDTNDGSQGAAGETSTVHSFQLGGRTPSVQYAASGRVNGHVLNQFAMDEWNGALRIATTSGKVPAPDVSSTISVLQQLRATTTLVRCTATATSTASGQHA